MKTRSSLSRALALALVAPLLACGGEAGETRSADARRPDAAAGPDTLPESVPAPEMEGGYLIVDPAQVREWQESGEPFILVDARDPVQFRQERIPGAINVPYVDIRAGGDLPPRDARVVLYCSDPSCPISQFAYDALQRLGYTNLYDMRAGLQGWKAAGYPTQIGESSTIGAGG
ncbi:MAG: rhodanese-like domain-containing protein, partial [Gemmatimonadetes bacterium]|nr:rhodanese-like domain-containing protein [Gemmatimonadota bacterium]